MSFSKKCETIVILDSSALSKEKKQKTSKIIKKGIKIHGNHNLLSFSSVRGHIGQRGCTP